MLLLRRCQLLEEASKKHERYVEIVNVDGYIFPIEILDLKISIGSITYNQCLLMAKDLLK
jgi:hypothetical protein